jgi:REP element-mobilizing transposase RayT
MKRPARPHPNVAGRFPPAYLLTFTTYGTWLHGDERGSVDRKHAGWQTPVLDPDHRRNRGDAGRAKSTPILLAPELRTAVELAIREVCAHRRWRLEALNVRTNHVHAVVGAAVPPEIVLTTLKAWATRRCRAAALLAFDRPLWTRHGSTRYLWTAEAIDRASEYVAEQQGPALGKVSRGEH